MEEPVWMGFGDLIFHMYRVSLLIILVIYSLVFIVFHRYLGYFYSITIFSYQ